MVHQKLDSLERRIGTYFLIVEKRQDETRRYLTQAKDWLEAAEENLNRGSVYRKHGQFTKALVEYKKAFVAERKAAERYEKAFSDRPNPPKSEGILVKRLKDRLYRSVRE